MAQTPKEYSFKQDNVRLNIDSFHRKQHNFYDGDKKIGFLYLYTNSVDNSKTASLCIDEGATKEQIKAMTQIINQVSDSTKEHGFFTKLNVINYSDEKNIAPYLIVKKDLSTDGLCYILDDKQIKALEKNNVPLYQLYDVQLHQANDKFLNHVIVQDDTYLYLAEHKDSFKDTTIHLLDSTYLKLSFDATKTGAKDVPKIDFFNKKGDFIPSFKIDNKHVYDLSNLNELTAAKIWNPDFKDATEQGKENIYKSLETLDEGAKERFEFNTNAFNKTVGHPVTVQDHIDNHLSHLKPSVSFDIK